MSCTSLNCTEIDDIVPNDCDVVLLGGSDQAIIFLCGSNVTDPSNATQVQNAINAGTAKLVQNIKVGLPLPTPVDLPITVSGQPPKVGTYDHTMTWYDANVSANNMESYNTLGKGIQIESILLYMNSEAVPSGRWIAPPASIFAKGGYTSPDDSTDVQHFEYTFFWKDQDANPEYVTIPAGIFN